MVQHLVWDEKSFIWLMKECLLPLFGAGLLYLALGLFNRMAYNPAPGPPAPAPFSYAWQEWVDPLGWLYISAVLAFQSGWDSAGFDDLHSLTLCCFLVGASTLLQLATALMSRGKDNSWQPPNRLKIFAAFLTLIVIVMICFVHVAVRLHPQRT